MSGIVLVYNNVQPHTALNTLHNIQQFQQKIFITPPPYSPDIAPSNYHIFLHLRSGLVLNGSKTVKSQKLTCQVPDFNAKSIKKRVP